MATNAGRWDRTLLKKIAKRPGARVEVERLLRGGMSGRAIAKNMGFPKSTWVSACKKNPLPGGPLDPDGNLAGHIGEWVDEGGLLRPWKGFNDKHKPRLFTPIVKKRRGRCSAPLISRGLLADYFDAVRDPPAAKAANVVAFKPAVQSRGTNAKAEAPDAPHAGTDLKGDLGEPIAEYEDGTSTGEPKPTGHKSARAVAKLAMKSLPIEERIRLLTEIAKNKDEPQTALRAIQTLNELDGTARKADEGPSRGNAPLFALPRGTRVSFAPVWPATPSASQAESESTEEQYPEDQAQKPGSEPQPS